MKDPRIQAPRHISLPVIDHEAEAAGQICALIFHNICARHRAVPCKVRVQVAAAHATSQATDEDLTATCVIAVGIDIAIGIDSIRSTSTLSVG
jgi:hypothetical protein